ncbi:3-hydroxyacyl-CoA dehydrogenase [Siculibacillus lacustris]|uniref:3-hydroxyacyl-CoA dehydrogenase n=1 Tax=Siculibacillus lacustris TaxID=1549641 RepID=A0A4Q9VS23_9HYPH|nr:3-hydroxyacyl-CoA dehydrogenase NAD-binding domain-containing protein [Siculibacillus lacustris]TBW38761.1 3-hydroxyacyl-CoA dehydrogenase [Siculibacillus lacustris]
MTGRVVKRIGVVGAGTIGASWAAYFLARGLDVVATDPAPGSRERILEMVHRFWPVLEAMGLDAGASLDRLTITPDGALDLDGVDFVQESGPEREDLKIDLFRRLDAVLPADVVIASSSSGLKISNVQSACAHPERCLIGHPFNPPHIIPLVEVVAGRQTGDAAMQAAIDFYRAIGKHPIRLNKEVTGHVANRLQGAVWREALHLVLTGVASAADVDDAMSYGPGMRWALMGPSLTFHLGGGEGGIGAFLKHLGGPVQSWWDDLGHPDLTPETIALVEAAILEEVAGRSTAELAARRDKFLLGLMRLKAEL